jgi:hypothetical protein
MKSTTLLVVLLAASSATAKPREWKIATVASINSNTADRGTAAVPLNGAVYRVPILITTTWYRIETSDTVYVLVWHNKKHPLNLTLHGQTKIALDGQNAHILDDAGKDVKVPIQEKIAK